MANTCCEQVINPPSFVAIACNKLHTLQHLTEGQISVPDWTQHTETAQQWIDEGHLVFGRKLLSSNSGKGIILFDQETITSPQECPLYTKYTKCKHEFRVHVMNGEVIDFVQKKKRRLTPEQEHFFNPHIKSHAHGWIFAREGVILPETIKEAALASISALGLDFGAVDIGYKVNEDKAFVYEVNTAPGLTGKTLQRYITAIKENYHANI